MRQAYWSQQAPKQKLIVIGQVHEYKPRPSYHPLDLLTRWVDKWVDLGLEKLAVKLAKKGWGPKAPNGQIYLPF